LLEWCRDDGFWAYHGGWLSLEPLGFGYFTQELNGDRISYVLGGNDDLYIHAIWKVIHYGHECKIDPLWLRGFIFRIIIVIIWFYVPYDIQGFGLSFSLETILGRFVLSILMIYAIGALEVGEDKESRVDDMSLLMTLKIYHFLVMFFSFFVEFSLKIEHALEHLWEKHCIFKDFMV
jgi:hypothetical protein